MEKIQMISVTPKGKYKIGLESGETITVTENVLVQYGLYKGLEIKSAKLAQIKQAIAIDTGYQQSLNYLSYQLRSRKEMHQYLKEKLIPQSAIIEILNKLTMLHLIDDKKYAESYVRTMVRTSDKGPSVIRRTLIQKGISDENIQIGLALFTTELQLQQGKLAAEKLLHKQRHANYQKKQQKIKTGLYQKGYDQGIIQQVLTTLIIEKDPEIESNLLEKAGEKLWLRHQKLDSKKRREKILRSLYQQGFNLDDAHHFITEKEQNND